MTLQDQRSLLERIFYSPNERRLRAGWRLLLHGLIFGILVFIIAGVIGVVLILTGNENLIENLLINQAIFMVCITLATYLARRFVDRRTFSSLGLGWRQQDRLDLVAGFFIPAVIMGAIFLAEWVLGWLEFRGFAWEAAPVSTVTFTVPLMFLVFVLVGWNEELLNRGYWMQNLTEGVNLPFGVIVSSILFGLLHLRNPNATWIAVVGISLAGLFFAYGYIRSKNLWLPIGLHIGWNFFENTIFGFPVSGIDTMGLLVHTTTGPEIITGGAFGPEAGLIVIPGMLLGWWLIYLWTRDRTGGGKQV